LGNTLSAAHPWIELLEFIYGEQKETGSTNNFPIYVVGLYERKRKKEGMGAG
jgi:hypothetical protein